jgi:DNA invertase Pin-like site-specific DNA recombinase
LATQPTHVRHTSRLSRKLADALRIKEPLDFAGVGVIFVSQGFDSCAPQSQTLLTVHGLVDGLYLEGLREKTFRGVEQLALQGLHTGGACSATVTWRSRTTPNWTGTGGQRSKACASRSIQTKRKRLYEFSNATPPAIR